MIPFPLPRTLSHVASGIDQSHVVAWKIRRALGEGRKVVSRWVSDGRKCDIKMVVCLSAACSPSGFTALTTTTTTTTQLG